MNIAVFVKQLSANAHVVRVLSVLSAHRAES
jgi:hypothetical protein